jgi:hypothetical protein
MPTPIFNNNATSTINGDLAFNATSFNIQPGDTGKFAVPAAGQYFMATIQDNSVDPPAIEIVQVTGVAGTLWTVVRAQEGTTALSFNNAGTTVSNRLTAGTLALFVGNAGTLEPQYIGAYSTAPTTMPNGTSLIVGTLYFNTTSSELFEWSQAGSWVEVQAQGGSGGPQLYLGEFATAPTTMNDGSPLVLGALYYNTTNSALYEYNGAWVLVVNVNYIVGNTTIEGNLLVSGNLTVQGQVSITGTLTLQDLVVTGTTDLQGGTSIEGTLIYDDLPVVAADELSGTTSTQNFPDGTIMQWGTGNYDTAVLFPQPFASVVNSIVITPNGAGGSLGGGGTSQVSSLSLTGFLAQFYMSGGGGQGTGLFYWQAIGK